MLLSIIIPIYNMEKYLGACLDSVICDPVWDDPAWSDPEKPDPAEVILVDDGSADRSGEIAAAYAEQFPFIRVLRQANSGVAAARNAGMRAARGEWLYFMDADDWLEENGISAVCRRIRQFASADILLFDAWQNGPGWERPWEHFDRPRSWEGKQVHALQRGMLYFPHAGQRTGIPLAAPWDKVYRASFLRDNRICFARQLAVLDDMVFNVEAFGAAEKVVYCKDQVYHYRQVASSVTHACRPDRDLQDAKVWNYLETYLRGLFSGQRWEREEKEALLQAYYGRVVKSFAICCRLCFFSRENRVSFSEKMERMEDTLRLRPYRRAVTGVRIGGLEWRLKAVTVLARLRLYGGIWLLCRAQDMLDGLRQRNGRRVLRLRNRLNAGKRADTGKCADTGKRVDIGKAWDIGNCPDGGNRQERKRVLFVTTKNPDYIRVTQELRLLRDRGLSARVICSASRHYWLRILQVYWKLLFVSQGEYEFVFLAFAPQLVWPVWAWKFRRSVLAVDFFVSFYDTLCFDRKKVSPRGLCGRLLHRLDASVLRGADQVICDTKAHGRYFSEEFHVPYEKMHPLYLEADRRIYHPVCGERPERMKGRYVVLYFGSGIPLQGVDVVWDAMERLKDRRELYFLFIGPLKKGTRVRRSVPDNLEYAEWLPQEQLAEHISWADLCLAGHFSADIRKASRTIPGKAYIYQAMEKRMILGENEANREVFSESDTVSFVEMGSGAALAEAIWKNFLADTQDAGKYTAFPDQARRCGQKCE